MAEYSLDNGLTYQGMDPIAEPSSSVTASVTVPGFLEAGVLSVCVRGTDEYGNTSEPKCIFLPVFDPEGGFVTGGGWIWPPMGAYSADPEAEGKANFGFVSKYKKGRTVPEGTTQFHFKADDLKFHSNSYEWLVVAGTKAMYKGVGTISGDGEFKFMLTAGDGDLKNNGGPDTFRISDLGGGWRCRGDDLRQSEGRRSGRRCHHRGSWLDHHPLGEEVVGEPDGGAVLGVRHFECRLSGMKLNFSRSPPQA